jgi:hypothetical protein
LARSLPARQGSHAGFQELADETFANLHAPWKLDRPADKQHPATIDYNIVQLHHHVVQFGIFAVAMA